MPGKKNKAVCHLKTKASSFQQTACRFWGDLPAECSSAEAVGGRVESQMQPQRQMSCSGAGLRQQLKLQRLLVVHPKESAAEDRNPCRSGVGAILLMHARPGFLNANPAAPGRSLDGLRSRFGSAAWAHARCLLDP